MYCDPSASVRSARAVSAVLLASAGLLLSAQGSMADLIVFNDFDQPPTNQGNLTFDEDRARTSFATVGAPTDLVDTTVRTQMRATDGAIGALVRWDARRPGPNGYFGAIRPDGTAQLGWAGGDWTVLREAATGLDAAANDISLQLTAIGNRIQLWTWPADQPMPDAPTLSMVDDTIAAGTVALGGIAAQFPSRGPIAGAFRFVQVEGIPIPEPTAAFPAAIAAGIAMLGWHRHRYRAWIVTSVTRTALRVGVL